MNGFCRYGPQVNYRDITALEVGTEVIVEGRSASDASPWWWILLPDSEAHCWVLNSVLELSDPVQARLLPIVDAPPLPPDAPPQLSIAERTCGATSQYTVLLSWEKASGADGYKVYRDDNQLATLDAKTLSYKDAPPLGGPYTYTVEAYNDSGAAGASVVEKECSPVQ